MRLNKLIVVSAWHRERHPDIDMCTQCARACEGVRQVIADQQNQRVFHILLQDDTHQQGT